MVSSKNQWLGGDDADLDFAEGEDSVNALEDPFVPSELSGEPVEYDEADEADPLDTPGSMGGRRVVTALKPQKTRKTRKSKGQKSKRKTAKSKKRKSSKKPKKSRKSRKSRRSRRSRRSRGGRMWANLSRAGNTTNAGMGLYKADAAGVVRPVAVTPVYNVKHI